ncbi:hypothetical protein N9045_00510 [bacterium]|nr:hypothetical protein [bacterium]
MSKLLKKISGRLGIVLEDEQNTSEIKELDRLLAKYRKEVESMIAKGIKQDAAVFKNVIQNAKSALAKRKELQDAEQRNAGPAGAGGAAPVASEDTSWKDPLSSNYDRRIAENALFHTIGPLTENPKWTSEWTSLGSKYSQAPSYFIPGGDAPIWTPEEITYAYAGDPKLIGPAYRDNPRAPAYGGGAPLYRMARKIARKYRRPNDINFIEENYQNGMVLLARMMKPGYDQAKSPFISFINRTIEGAVESGSKRTGQAVQARADIKRILDTTDINKIGSLISPIKGKYKTEKLWDKHEGNPYGPLTPSIYKSAGKYMAAISNGDEQSQSEARSELELIHQEIEDEAYILGATTGSGQAVSTPDRNVTSVGLTSMDLPAGEEGKGTFGDTLPGDTNEDSAINSEMVNYVLDLSMNYDLGKLLASSPKYSQMAIDLGAKKGKIGGKLAANEFRYLIRALGPIASNYSGKGQVRDTTKPRDSVGWWQPGTDPEIEPIPNSEDNVLWKSIWSRNGYQAMTGVGRDGFGIEVNAIAEEMTQEVVEFNKLGIPTARKLKTKVDKRTGQEVPAPVVSPTSISNALRSAQIKFKILADIEKDKFGLDESKQAVPILEELRSLDDCDFQLVKETAKKLASLIILKEDIPKSNVKFTPILKENRRISNGEANQLLNQLGMSEQDIVKLLNQLGAGFRSGENNQLSNVIKRAVKHIADNFKLGFSADLDLDKISDMVNHVWEKQSNTQHSIGKSPSDDDDMPMVGKDIQSRF